MWLLDFIGFILVSPLRIIHVIFELTMQKILKKAVCIMSTGVTLSLAFCLIDSQSLNPYYHIRWFSNTSKPPLVLGPFSEQSTKIFIRKWISGISLNYGWCTPCTPTFPYCCLLCVKFVSSLRLGAQRRLSYYQLVTNYILIKVLNQLIFSEENY